MAYTYILVEKKILLLGERIMANEYKRLYRSVDDRMIAGICAGIADYFDAGICACSPGYSNCRG